MELFDLIRTIFTDRQAFASLSWYEKGKDMFMVQRRFSIRYPHIAELLNRSTRNPGATVEFWQSVLGGQKMPGWVFTKAKKNEAEKAFKADPELASVWMRMNGLGKRELEEFARLDPAGLKRELGMIKNAIQ